MLTNASPTKGFGPKHYQKDIYAFPISKYVAVIDKRGIHTDAISISSANQHQEDKNSQLVKIVNEHPANIWQVNMYQQYTKDLSGKRNYHMAQGIKFWLPETQLNSVLLEVFTSRFTNKVHYWV